MEHKLIHKNSRLEKNNFDLLRLVFAVIVCLVHADALSDYQALAIIPSILSSAAAVKAFFVVSGFLIFMSYERSSSIQSYTTKRFWRIYPAYFTAILLPSVFFIAISSENISNYYSTDWFKYIVANLSFLNFLQYNLPGVFDNNKIQAVNGALWTLKIEVMFYLSVPIIVFLFKKLGRLKVILIIYLLSIIYSALCLWLADKMGSNIYLILSRQLPGQLSYFIAGAFFYYYLPFFERNIGYFLMSAIIILTANAYWQIGFVEPFAIATIVIFFALFLYLGNFGKYGDFSYGMYILHFPIIQCFVAFGIFSNSPWIFLLSIILVTLIMAFAMWHLIEKRFLSKKNHYVKTNQI